jgi:hypothetical protein
MVCQFIRIAAILSVLCLSLPGWLSAQSTPAQAARDRVAADAKNAAIAAAAAAVAVQPTAADPQQVSVGIYLISVYDLDLAANTFYADMYVWLKWRGEIDPTASMEFVNGVEKWGQTSTAVYPEPQTLPDGSSYNIYRVEGRFFHAFELNRYPFDAHDLGIVIEDNTYNSSTIQYVADVDNSQLGDGLQIPGWNLDGWEMKVRTHHYRTNFGDPRDGVGGSDYTNAAFNLKISRGVRYFLWKLLLPLLLVLVLAWSALLVHPDRVDVRSAMAATALLTAVFLQLSYSSTLPEVGYLTLLDRVYVLAYILIVGVLASTLATARYIAGAGGTAQAVSRAIHFDHLSLLAQILAFAGVMAVLLLG